MTSAATSRSASAPADRTAPRVPVFVDRTGQRRRVLARAGLAAAVLLVAVAVGLVLAATGGGHGLLPGLPGAARTPATGPAHAVQPGSVAPTSTSPTAGGRAGATTGPTASGTKAPQPSPAPHPTAGTGTAPSPSPSSPHRHVPTQTPSHKK